MFDRVAYHVKFYKQFMFLIILKLNSYRESSLKNQVGLMKEPTKTRWTPLTVCKYLF